MPSNSELQLDVSQLRAKRKRYDLINLAVITTVLCCYVAGFFIYQSYIRAQQALIIDQGISSPYELRRHFTRNLYKAITHHGFKLAEGVVAYDSSSFSLELGDCVFISGFSDDDREPIVTATFIADWKQHQSMPKPVEEALTVFLEACENTYDEQVLDDLRQKLQIRDHLVTPNNRLLVISEHTRYELSFMGRQNYQLVLWASPRGSLRSFNFAKRP